MFRTLCLYVQRQHILGFKVIQQFQNEGVLNSKKAKMHFQIKGGSTSTNSISVVSKKKQLFKACLERKTVNHYSTI